MPPNTPLTAAAIRYPDSDGRRMAENTLQAEWILTIFGNIDLLFRDRADVFVAMQNPWHPLEDRPKRRAAPDVSVVFGRPKGRRDCYKQWEEGGVPTTVVFEVLPRIGWHQEMIQRFRFSDRFGVEEFYLIDPHRRMFDGWHRKGKRIRSVKFDVGFVSPRLGVRFEWQPGSNVSILGPDGKPFLPFVEPDVEPDAIISRHPPGAADSL